MLVKQISVFLENQAGRIAEAANVLYKKNINIRTLSIADTEDFGILRLIVNDPDKAYEALREAGFTVSTTEVIAISIADRPGGLLDVLSIFEEIGLTIEYSYAFPKVGGGSAFVIIRVEDPQKAVDALLKRGVKILPSDQVYT